MNRTPDAVAHIVLSLDPGGLERFVCSLVSCPEMNGVRPFVYCLDRRGVLADIVERSGGTVVVEPRGAGFDLRIILRLAEFLRRNRIRVVHTHGLDPMFYTAFAALLAGTPVRIHTQHDTFVDTWSRKDRLKFRIASLSFTAVAGVSEQSRAGMLRAGAPPHNAVTVLNGIGCPPCAIQRNGSSPVVGTVARLAPEKGIDRLLQAFSWVRAVTGAALVIVGDGPERPRLEALAAELGLADAVEFAGYTSDVETALARMDVFALASRSEGIPLALLEAMAAGLPVVATRVGGVPEVVADGDTGILVPSGDVHALAGAITELLNDPERRRATGQRGRERVRTHFSHARMARSYRALYTPPEDLSPVREAIKSASHLLPARMLCWRGQCTDGGAAITFDDGPDPVYTPRVLRILKEHGVLATFFLVGERAQEHPDLVRRILDDGHEIGNHSYTHPHFDRLSIAQAGYEIDRTQDVLARLQNKPCRLFRPPRGKLCVSSLAAAWRRGLTVVLWSIDLKDYASKDAEQIRDAAVLRPARNGDIVLYHGLSDPAIEALPQVLEAAAAAGQRLRPVSLVAKLRT